MYLGAYGYVRMAFSQGKLLWMGPESTFQMTRILIGPARCSRILRYIIFKHFKGDIFRIVSRKEPSTMCQQAPLKSLSLGSDDGFVPSSKKPLPEPVLTQSFKLINFISFVAANSLALCAPSAKRCKLDIVSAFIQMTANSVAGIPLSFYVQFVGYRKVFSLGWGLRWRYFRISLSGSHRILPIPLWSRYKDVFW